MLVLILAGIKYKIMRLIIYNIAKKFAKIIAIINPIAVAYVFKATCCSIFEHLLAVGFKNKKLFGFFSTYFSIIETNSWGILYLYCLI